MAAARIPYIPNSLRNLSFHNPLIVTTMAGIRKNIMVRMVSMEICSFNFSVYPIKIGYMILFIAELK